VRHLVLAALGAWFGLLVLYLSPPSAYRAVLFSGVGGGERLACRRGEHTPLFATVTIWCGGDDSSSGALLRRGDGHRWL